MPRRPRRPRRGRPGTHRRGRRREQPAEGRERRRQVVERDHDPAEQQAGDEQRVGEGQHRLGPQRPGERRPRPANAAVPTAARPRTAATRRPGPGRQPKAATATPSGRARRATSTTRTVRIFAAISPVRASGDPPSRLSTPYDAFVGRRDPEADEARGDDREGERARQQEVDRRLAPGPARGPPSRRTAGPPPACRRARAGSRRAARSGAAPSRPGRASPATSSPRRSCRADQGEVASSSDAADRARFHDQQSLGRGPRRERRGQARRRRHARDAVPVLLVDDAGTGPCRGRRSPPPRRARAGARSAGAAADGGPRRARRACPRRRSGRHEDRDPVGDPLDVGEVVARQQDRDAVGPEVRDDPPASRHGPRGPSRRSARRAGRPRAARRAPARGRAAAARRPTGAGSGCPAASREPDEVEQLVGVARVRVERGVLAEDLARPGAHVDAAALEHQPDPGAQRRGRRSQGPTRARGRCRRPPADTPRRSRRSWSCPRRSARGARTISPAATCERDAVDHRSIAIPLDQRHRRSIGGPVTARSARTGVRSRRR